MMYKKIFICLVFSLLFVCFQSELVLAEEDKPAMVMLAKNDDVVIKQKFIRHFENRFPKSIMENLAINFNAFFMDAKSLLKKDADLLVLVDKKNFLPADYEPSDLIELKSNHAFIVSKKGMYARKTVVDALTEMSLAARAEGLTIVVSSAYRSYKYQKNLFDRYVRDYGEKEASRFSARAGTSQHQLGTALDFGSISDEWARTKAGIWVNKNASRFGFSLSFPKGYESITGYKWECWHFRYIGVDACKMQAKWFGDIQQYMLEALDFLQDELKL